MTVKTAGICHKKAQKAQKLWIMSGVSLIEILIGLVLLTLLLIPSINVLSSGIRTVAATRDHLQAVFLAQRILEAARTTDFPYLAQFQQPNEKEKIKTLEWDLTHDKEGGPERISREEKINEIVYKISDVKFDGVWTKDDPDHKIDPIIILIKFSIEYKSREGKSNRFQTSSAISRRE